MVNPYSQAIMFPKSFSTVALCLSLSVLPVAAMAHGGGDGGYGAGSSHLVNGYTTRRGTYVTPYQDTNPNGTKLDNYSTRGNVNPCTGAVGTRDPH